MSGTSIFRIGTSNLISVRIALFAGSRSLHLSIIDKRAQGFLQGGPPGLHRIVDRAFPDAFALRLEIVEKGSFGRVECPLIFDLMLQARDFELSTPDLERPQFVLEPIEPDLILGSFFGVLSNRGHG